jgi:hypothetical protein
LFRNRFRFINGNETGNTSLCGKSRYNPFHTVIGNDADGITLVNAKLGQTCPEIIDAGVDFFTGHPFVNAFLLLVSTSLLSANLVTLSSHQSIQKNAIKT